MPLDIEKLLDIPEISDVQLSPDGHTIAYVFGGLFKRDQDSPHEKSIHLLDVKSGKIRALTGSDTWTNLEPRWSPDSTRLVFASNRINKRDMQVYVIDVDGGEARAITRLNASASWLQWSPDGRSIAFLMDGSTEAAPQEDPDPLVMDANPKFNSIWTVDVENSELRAVTPADYHIHEHAWSPDGSMFAAVVSSHPNPMQGWYTAQLYVVNTDGGDFRQVCAIKGQFGRLTWSPDSRNIAFVSGVMSDEGNVAGEVFTVSARSGEPRNLTPGIDHSITWIDWRDAGILYGARHIEACLLGWLDPQTGEMRQISRGAYAVNGHGEERVSAQGGVFAAVRESHTEAPNIYLGSLEREEWRQLTHLAFDTDAFPPLHVEDRHWSHPDGTPVHGYVVFPPGYQSGRPYPMVVNVHGGPSLSFIPGYANRWVRLFIDKGCIVLLPNPRGSWGRGHAYQAANVGDLGGGDWQDVMAGIDVLVDEGIADPNQLAIAGWSYAGFLVTWAVTQTDRFRCAIAGANITNYVSNYGVVLNREWQSTMFGSNVFDEMDLHWSRSPIKYMNRVKTPTLLVHGAEDKVAPPQQSIEFYIGLKHFGIPAQLVLYPREPHGFQERAHQSDLLERMNAWLDKYLFDR